MFKQAFNIVSTTVRGHIGAYGLPFVQDKPTEYGLGYSLVAKYAYDSFTSPYGTVRRNRKEIGRAVQQECRDRGESRMPSSA